MEKLSAEAADPSRPWRGAGEPVVEQSVATKGVFVPPFSNESLGKNFISDELMSRADQVLLIGPNTIDLTTFNGVLDDGVRWNVEWVQVLRPADSVLLYAFGVCR